MTVGERIRNKRIELNMTQDELAKKVGYKSRSSIQKIEAARDLPLKKISLMAKALDCSPGYLMGWEEAEPLDDPALFEVEWRKRGGAAHQLILTKEEEDFILEARTIKKIDENFYKRMMAYIKAIKEV